MPTQILMPALSPTMTEGNLTRWLKKEGDIVKAGQVLAEIETDKATMEVEAVDEGKLIKILIEGGTQGIKVNTPIALLADDGEDVTAVDAAKPKTQAKATGDKSSEIKSLHVGVGPSGTGAPSNPPSPPSPALTSAPTAVQQARTPADKVTSRIIATPLAKRIAELASLDLKNVTGTGPNGRILKADVEKARAAPGASVRSSGVAQGIDARDYATKLGMAFDVKANSGIRKVIARRLTEAKQLVPHFYLTIDCEIDQLLALRKGINEVGGSKVSVNDCVIRAVALALKKVPAANASWTDDAILLYKDVDVSVAVATPNGLITPIIKKADTKALAQISSEMKDLAGRARDGKLKPEEFQGGGFSVSNLGMFGIREFAAIINPPQSCILAVGAGEQRAVVKNGQLAIATVMTCTLSIDHRSVDGAVGAEFLAAFKPIIENPYALVV